MIGYSLIQLVITLIIVCAVVGIALVAVRASGVQIPAWVVQIGWIVLIALVAILAIKFLVGVA